ncbi:hypothetical protein [Acinetobacter ihumii]|uniref:hypothetical protein n=1 Tax=Acinetobacter ihumii TaxID=2483802 RepID=UPI001D187B11|nr:hypothetical protein [Acinetobacter ihumii]
MSRKVIKVFLVSVTTAMLFVGCVAFPEEHHRGGYGHHYPDRGDDRDRDYHKDRRDRDYRQDRNNGRDWDRRWNRPDGRWKYADRD